MDYIPDFCEDAVSSSAYPIDKESIFFTYCIWKRLMTMIEKAQLPLPRATVVVAKWNCCKGRIDEMTRHLDEMNFIFRRGTPKQMLIMREFKKMALNVYFTQRHCSPDHNVPVGEGCTTIQLSLWNRKKAFKDVLHKLASSYQLHDQMRRVPKSPRCRIDNIDTNED